MENIYIIDDFYDNPDSIRKLALNATYNEFQNSNVAGYESEKSFYSDSHISKFEDLLNSKIIINQEKLIFGKFRYSLKNSVSNTHVHFDRAEWSAIIYLTEDKNCKGGLGIYSNKSTNLQQVPQSLRELNELGYNDLNHFDHNIVMKDTNDIDCWNILEYIPMKYNRMVLFQGSQYFHAITEKFGESINDSRLSHNFFFNIKKDGTNNV